ncbi:hypothetical protein L204_105490 [Cryptococcus depauperatus]|nr:hypothetical protein L204_02741 [Cryptococcus depauperatus CBS 7855]
MPLSCPQPSQSPNMTATRLDPSQPSHGVSDAHTYTTHTYTTTPYPLISLFSQTSKNGGGGDHHGDSDDDDDDPDDPDPDSDSGDGGFLRLISSGNDGLGGGDGAPSNTTPSARQPTAPALTSGGGQRRVDTVVADVALEAVAARLASVALGESVPAPVSTTHLLLPPVALVAGRRGAASLGGQRRTGGGGVVVVSGHAGCGGESVGGGKEDVGFIWVWVWRGGECRYHRGWDGVVAIVAAIVVVATRR